MAEIKITPVKKRFRKTKIVLLSFFLLFIVLHAALFLFLLLEMLSKEKTEKAEIDITAIASNLSIITNKAKDKRMAAVMSDLIAGKSLSSIRRQSMYGKYSFPEIGLPTSDQFNAYVILEKDKEIIELEVNLIKFPKINSYVQFSRESGYFGKWTCDGNMFNNHICSLGVTDIHY